MQCSWSEGMLLYFGVLYIKHVCGDTVKEHIVIQAGGERNSIAKGLRQLLHR